MFIASSHAHSRNFSVVSFALGVSIIIQSVYCYQSSAFSSGNLVATKMQTPTEEKLSPANREIELEPVKLDKSDIDTGKQIDRARQVNLLPLPLQVTDADEDTKLITEADREKQHLFELWESTLCRSPDIQFVVQKLMPTSDKNRTNTVLLRAISTIVSNGVNAGAIAFNTGPMAVAGSQVTSNMLQSLLNLRDAKGNTLSQIDQGQILMLYQMVRSIADNVSETYRDYKYYVRKIDSAQGRAVKLQSLIQDTRAEQDALKQIEMEYWIDRVKEEVGDVVYMARRNRQKLVDFAGNDSVSKIDKSFEEQFIEEKEIERKNSESAVGDRPKVPDITREAISRLLNSAHPQK